MFVKSVPLLLVSSAMFLGLCVAALWGSRRYPIPDVPGRETVTIGVLPEMLSVIYALLLLGSMGFRMNGTRFSVIGDAMSLVSVLLGLVMTIVMRRQINGRNVL